MEDLLEKIPLDMLAKYKSGCLHEHELQVAFLCHCLHQGLVRLGRANGNHQDESLLHAAALLHDLGRIINSRDHHQHIEYLILHDCVSDGLSQRERKRLAALCGAHRKGRPVDLAKIDQEDRGSFLGLVAILQAADGLARVFPKRICLHETEDGIKLRILSKPCHAPSPSGNICNRIECLGSAGSLNEKQRKRLQEKLHLADLVFNLTLE